jgi:TorA maturation chaperone TorD
MSIMVKESLKDKIAADKQRMLSYKLFSVGFSYPDDNFFKYFPDLLKSRPKILKTYDSLFRNKGLWLYTTEYTSEGTFQKSKALSDITGFYKAFGLEVKTDRSDSLVTELEFMHYLIFKTIYALEKQPDKYQDKANLCLEAQVKFFSEYLYPGAKAISDKILSENQETIYKSIVSDLLDFLKQESQFFKQLVQ